MANEERESCPGQMPERVAEMAEALAETAQAYAAEMGCGYPECADCEAAGYCPGHKAAKALAKHREEYAGYARRELTFGEPADDGTDVVFPGPTGEFGPAKAIDAMTDEERVTDAAMQFVAAHRAWAETLPHNRRPCTKNADSPSCYCEAWNVIVAEGLSSPTDEELEIDTWCENCRHNRRMALLRGGRAAKRNGALRRLVCAAERIQRPKAQAEKAQDYSEGATAR